MNLMILIYITDLLETMTSILQLNNGKYGKYNLNNDK